MNDLVQLREYAKKEAERFRADLLARLGLVLESHTTSLVDFMVDMQGRLDSAEALLIQVAEAQVLGQHLGFSEVELCDETMKRIKALVINAKARTK